MHDNTTARQRWNELHGERRNFIERCRKYSALTIPSMLPPEGYTQENYELVHDWNSFGAQIVNHLNNELQMTLFNPSRPFFRLNASQQIFDQMAAATGVDQSEIKQGLSIAERDALAIMEKAMIRTKLFDATRHLIVFGNALVYMGDPDKVRKSRKRKTTFRVFGIDKYVVKRDIDGDVLEMVVVEHTTFSQLKKEIREACPQEYERAKTLCLYKWIKLDDNNDYIQTTWIEDTLLPEKFGGSWPEDRCPWVPLTWKLSSGASYGTGHVEEYFGALAALSSLSRSMIESAILSSKYVWLVAPGGTTSIEDVVAAESGDCIAGNEGDLSLVQPETSSSLPVIQSVATEYIQRLGRGFLMTSATTRDAERVTAEEIRRNAVELEKGLGGAYSQIAEDFQTPIAYWLLDQVEVNGKKLKVSGEGLSPVIITGLDALSRNSDVENLKLALSEVIQITSLPPQVAQLLKVDAIIKEIGAGRGIDLSKYMLTQDQVNALQQAQYDQNLAMAQLPPEQLNQTQRPTSPSPVPGAQV